MTIISWLVVTSLWVAWIGLVSRQMPKWLFSATHHHKFWKKKGWYILSAFSYLVWLYSFIQVPSEPLVKVLSGIVPLVTLMVFLRALSYWRMRKSAGSQGLSTSSSGQRGKWYDMSLSVSQDRALNLPWLKQQLLLIPELLPSHQVTLKAQPTENNQQSVSLRFKALSDEQASLIFHKMQLHINQGQPATA